MKKLILSITIVLTLNSCSTPEQTTTSTQKTAVEEKWVKYPGATEFVFTGEIRPLQPQNQNYNDCEMWAGTTPPNPSNMYSQSSNGQTWVINWRIACR